MAVSVNWGPCLGSPYSKSPTIILRPVVVANSRMRFWCRNCPNHEARNDLAKMPYGPFTLTSRDGSRYPVFEASIPSRSANQKLQQCSVFGISGLRLSPRGFQSCSCTPTSFAAGPESSKTGSGGVRKARKISKAPMSAARYRSGVEAWAPRFPFQAD